MKKVWICAGAFLAVTGVARADDCAHAMTQLAMNECAQTSMQAAAARLQQVYGRIVRRLAGNADATTDLATAQKTWVAYRDAECAFRSSSSVGGSMHAMVVAGCSARMTTDRVAVLRAYLSCSEGDAECPVPRP